MKKHSHLLDLSEWKFRIFFSDWDKVYINGLNIWDYKWNYTGVFVEVIHPTYKNQVYHEQVCFIENELNIVYFLAFEFSMNSWGLYLKDDYRINLVKFK